MEKVQRWALGAGLAAGALDAGLVAVADPGAGALVGVQSFVAWAGIGWAAVATRGALSPVPHALLVTFALDLPWVLALGPGAGHPEHVPPLAGMAALVGLGLGWAPRRALR